MKKKLLVLIMMIAVGLLSGCGMSEEEASEYVKASLDAVYKGEFEAFVEITDSTPEGAQAMYEENIVHTMENAGLYESEISEELTDKYKQLFTDLINAVEYTVGEATETEDGDYDVCVEVRPLLCINELDLDDVTDKLLAEINDMKKYPSEDKITEMTYEIIYEILAEKIENPTYGDETVEHIVSVHKNESGMYYISEEDMSALDTVMFAQ